MIALLTGLVASLDESTAIIDVAGVGYLVQASTRTLAALPRPPEPARLLIETIIREDAFLLFGFADPAERDWFRLLTTVQGVGAKVALGILSALSPKDLATAIGAGRSRRAHPRARRRPQTRHPPAHRIARKIHRDAHRVHGGRGARDRRRLGRVGRFRRPVHPGLPPRRSRPRPEPRPGSGRAGRLDRHGAPPMLARTGAITAVRRPSLQRVQGSALAVFFRVPAGGTHVAQKPRLPPITAEWLIFPPCLVTSFATSLTQGMG